MKRKDPTATALTPQDMVRLRRQVQTVLDTSKTLLQENNFEEIITSAERAIQLLEGINHNNEDKNTLIYLYETKAFAHHKLKADSMSIFYYEKANALYTQLPLPQSDDLKKKRINCLNHIGNLYLKKTLFHKALESFKAVLMVLDALLQKDDAAIRIKARIFDRMADCHKKLLDNVTSFPENFPALISCHNSAIQERSSLSSQNDEDKELLAQNHIGISEGYLRSGNTVKVIEHRTQASRLFEQIKETSVKEKIWTLERENISALADIYVTSIFSQSCFCNLQECISILQSAIQKNYFGKNIYYERLANYFTSLSKLSMPHSLEFYFYLLSEKVVTFNQEFSIFQFQLEYQMLCLAILKGSSFQQQQLLALMEFIKRECTSSTFPNKLISSYLAKLENLNLFEDCIAKLKKAISACAPSVTPEMLLALQSFKPMEKEIQTLKEENEKLKEENKQLKEKTGEAGPQQQTHTSQINPNLSFFPSSSSTSSNTSNDFPSSSSASSNTSNDEFNLDEFDQYFL